MGAPRVQAVEAVLRPHPEAVLPVDVESGDAVVGDGGGLVGVVHVRGQLARADVEAEQAVLARPDPERVVLGRIPQHPDVPAGQLRLAQHAVARALPHGQPAAGGHPDVARAVLFRVPDEAVGERGGVGGVVLVDLEGHAVVAVEAVLGGEPDVPAPVLEDVHDRGLRETLLQGQAIEADRPRRRGHRRRRDRQSGQGQHAQDAVAMVSQFHVSALHEPVHDAMGPRPRWSSPAKTSAGTAGENRNPWYSLHP